MAFDPTRRNGLTVEKEVREEQPTETVMEADTWEKPWAATGGCCKEVEEGTLGSRRQCVMITPQLRCMGNLFPVYHRMHSRNHQRRTTHRGLHLPYLVCMFSHFVGSLLGTSPGSTDQTSYFHGESLAPTCRAFVDGGPRQ